MAQGRDIDGSVLFRRRAERLEARITSEQKLLIEHAAALEGRSITDFVIASVQTAAKRTVAEHQIVELSVKDSRAFVDALINPRPPSEQMRKRVARYRKVVDDASR